MTDELKTPEEWCAELGVDILDPDGWRGRDGRPWTDPITRAEFEQRLITCTQRIRTKAADDRSEMQANRAAGLAKRHERRLAQADLAVIKAAIEHLPATCRYHGDNLERSYDYIGRACCDTGKPALARRKAEEALRRLEA